MSIQKIFSLLFLLLWGLSCTHDEIKQSGDAKILSYQWIELPKVTFNIESTKITAKVPKGSDLSHLTALYSLSDKAQLFVGSTEQISGETKNDFTQALTYTVQAPGHIKTNYTFIITEVENIAPIAKAGADQSYLLPSTQTVQKISLSAYFSDDIDGEIVKYKWQQGNTLLGQEKTLEVELPIGTHTITLTVEDNAGATNQDKVIISIQTRGIAIPVDSEITPATKNLLNNLAKVANSEQFIFGQEFPMSFKLNSLRNDLSTSDSKEVTGDHPGVFGIDPHYMLYKTASEKQLHIDEAKYAYNNGAVVTLDFHQQSKSDKKIYINDITTATDKSLMYDIVNDLNGSRAWFFGEMDQIITIINVDLNFPVVLRLFHEMDGGWFWWGSKATNHSTQLYIDFYKLTVDYVKNRTDLVLFAWSPNRELNTSYYPGDAYVDIVGVDIYDTNGPTIKQSLIELTNFSLSHNKVAALTEVGRNNFIANDPDFWSNTLLQSIKDGGSSIKIAWVLGWFNAPWKSSQDDLFIPNSASNSSVKNDFIKFKNDPQTLFMEDVKSLKMYDK